MVTIASFSFPYEAQIARGKLESEGVPAVVADEHTINMQWLYSDAIGGVKVQVPGHFVDQARQVLGADYSEALVAEQGDDKLLCPQCGSDKTELLIKGKRMAFLLFLILLFPFWPHRRQIKCRDCGRSSDY